MILVYNAHLAAHPGPDGVQVCEYCNTTLIDNRRVDYPEGREPAFFEDGAFVEKLCGGVAVVSPEEITSA